MVLGPFAETKVTRLPGRNPAFLNGGALNLFVEGSKAKSAWAKKEKYLLETNSKRSMTAVPTTSPQTLTVVRQ